MQVSAGITYDQIVEGLDEEFAAVKETIAGIGPDDWERRCSLAPIDPAQPTWTVKELVKHYDIATWLALNLYDNAEAGPIEKDRVSFFLFDRSQVAPVVYDFAVQGAAGKSPEQVVAECHATLDRTMEVARSTDPGLTGPGYFGRMRLDDFLASRFIEAVVHHIDLTDTLGVAARTTPAATSYTATLLDDILARKQVPGRPADLSGDLAWIRAAGGRTEHPDGRLPLLG
jgi:uncharacterized protein (TIGR03083 family)